MLLSSLDLVISVLGLIDDRRCKWRCDYRVGRLPPSWKYAPYSGLSPTEIPSLELLLDGSTRHSYSIVYGEMIQHGAMSGNKCPPNSSR